MAATRRWGTIALETFTCIAILSEMAMSLIMIFMQDCE